MENSKKSSPSASGLPFSEKEGEHQQEKQRNEDVEEEDTDDDDLLLFCGLTADSFRKTEEEEKQEKEMELRLKEEIREEQHIIENLLLFQLCISELWDTNDVMELILEGYYGNQKNGDSNTSLSSSSRIDV